MSTFADLKYSNSDVPGLGILQVKTTTPKRYRSGLQPISQHQAIIEKLKLESLAANSNAYKTVAHFTFHDGSVQEGVLELDSSWLRIRENFIAPTSKKSRL